MRRLSYLAMGVFLLSLTSAPAFGQEKEQAKPKTETGAQAPTTPPAPPAAKPADVASPDAILAATYDVISGPAGQKRDWDRFRSLFLSGATHRDRQKGRRRGHTSRHPGGIH